MVIQRPAGRTFPINHSDTFKCVRAIISIKTTVVVFFFEPRGPAGTAMMNQSVCVCVCVCVNADAGSV